MRENLDCYLSEKIQCAVGNAILYAGIVNSIKVKKASMKHISVFLFALDLEFND